VVYVAVDVDGTLARSNVSFLFGKYLYKKKVISLFSAVWMAGLYFLHRVGLLSLKKLHTKIFFSLFKGKSSSFFKSHAKDFFSSYTNLFRMNVLDDVQRRKKTGEKVVLLSASPDFLVRIIAEILSLQEWYGTEYLVDEQGNFSEVRRILTGEEKAILVKKATRQRVGEKEQQSRLVSSTLSEEKSPGRVEATKGRYEEHIVAMSDSCEDLPLLLLADEVFLVAPSRALRAEASKRNWKEIR
jgi:HAD superfamily phosphoserine phosphatase-like hydrolase